MRKALIIVDTQNDFCEGGALAVEGGNRVARSIADFIGIYEHGPYSKIVVTKDWHIDPGAHWSYPPDYVDTWPRHCEAGTPGADLNPVLQEFNFDEYFLKGEYEAAYSGFEGVGLLDPLSSLDGYLIRNKITHVDVCGLALDYCVRATAMDASARGYVTRVLLEWTAAVHSDPASVSRVLDELTAAGVRCE